MLIAGRGRFQFVRIAEPLARESPARPLYPERITLFRRYRLTQPPDPNLKNRDAATSAREACQTGFAASKRTISARRGDCRRRHNPLDHYRARGCPRSRRSPASVGSAVASITSTIRDRRACGVRRKGCAIRGPLFEANDLWQPVEKRGARL